LPKNWSAWHTRVRIAETPMGKGVFAIRKFRKDQVIGAISGVVIDDPTYGSAYCMDLGGMRSLEPIEPYRYLNHSCTPNCEIFTWEYETPQPTLPTQLFLQALRTIISGEELTIDYAWSADAAIPCLCGSQKCRGWVVDVEEIDKVQVT
jgi:uncharacterized protein